jgi:hypothetical protein
MTSDPYTFVTFIGPVELIIAPPELPPFKVDAIVEEQDTGLLLGVAPKISEPYESYDKLVSQMITQQPRLPGEVVVKGNHPLRFLAVVHNLELEPTWKEEWITNALGQIFKESVNNRIKTVAMPVLGSIYGSLNYENFIGLFRSALPTGNFTYPEKIWLIVPAPECNWIMRLFTLH